MMIFYHGQHHGKLFKTLKLLSDFTVRFTESPPPDLDTEPQLMPDHVSESNVSASAGDSPLPHYYLSNRCSWLPRLWPNMTIRRVAPTRLAGHRMHDISEDVRGESSENEDEGPAEPASSSFPREIIQGLRIFDGTFFTGTLCDRVWPDSDRAIAHFVRVVRDTAATDSSPR